MMKEILQSLVDFHYNTTTRFIKDLSMIFLGTSVYDCSSEIIRSYSKVVKPQTERIQQLCSFFIQLCLMIYGGWHDFGSVRKRNRFSNEGTEMHLKHSLWLKCVTFTTVLNQQCLETMTTIKECVQPSLKLCSVVCHHFSVHSLTGWFEFHLCCFRAVWASLVVVF